MLRKIKDIRSAKLIELSDKKQLQHNKKYIGQNLEVLVEEREGEYVKGHTTNYIMVHIKTQNESLENTIVKVHIENTFEDGLIGNLIDM